MATIQKIVPCLWFDDQAEEAVRLYTSVFKNSKIVKTTRYGKAGQEVHGHRPGSIMTVTFELAGQPFMALNGGPLFRFTEAVSLMVSCETQDEIDHFWDKLSAGGDPKAQQCGWLKDRYGLSWQVVPTILPDLVGDPDSNKSQRAMQAMLTMKKLDIAKLKQAWSA